MSQAKPDRVSVQEILKLVDRLSTEEQDELAEEMKLQWLRRELGKAEESISRGEGIPGEVVLEELRQRSENRLRKSQQ